MTLTSGRAQTTTSWAAALALSVVGASLLGAVATPAGRQPPRLTIGPAEASELPGRAPTGLHRLVRSDELRALRTFFERVDVTEIAQGVAQPRGAGGDSLGAVLSSISEDWEAPFHFVRDMIEYVPYSGAVRGETGVLASRGGNSLDQALVLRAMMRVRGHRTRLARGDLTWEDAAQLATGSSSPEAPQPGDPWPRWLESAAEHWWLQAEREGDWVDLDPSFVDNVPGEARARDADFYEAVPDELRTSVSVELKRGELTVAEATFASDTIVGASVDLMLESLPLSAAVDLVRFVQELERIAVALERVGGAFGIRGAPNALREQEGGDAPGGPTDVPGVVSPGEQTDSLPSDPQESDRATGEAQIDAELNLRDAAELFFRTTGLRIEADAGPWRARLLVPGQELEAGPFEAADVATLLLRVTVRLPSGPDQVLEIPWSSGGGRITAVVGAGGVSESTIVRTTRPLYDDLTRLAGIEGESREAMRPPIAYHDAVESLRRATVDAWDAFAEHAPVALAWATLRGVDRVSVNSRSGRVVRQGLRMAAVRWRPPRGQEEGFVAIVLADPITVGRLTGLSSAAELRAAYGLLQSAVVSQILNRLAGRAPDTAFDVTLRAIGTGQGLTGLVGVDGPPSAWPGGARAAANPMLRAGYAILGPEAFGGETALGWWQVGVADGETTGWVWSEHGPVQGAVWLGSAWRSEFLDTLLASLPALHRAVRWLAGLTGTGPTGLGSIPVAACASGAVAADALGARLPSGWPRPAVLYLCASP